MLVFIFLIDPADTILHLKIPVFCLIICTWVANKAQSRKITVQKWDVVVFLLYLTIPIIGILSAIIQANFTNPSFAFGFLKSIILLALVIIVSDTHIRMDKILIHVSIILPLLTFYAYYFFLNEPIYFNDVIFPYLSEESGTAMFAHRSYYGFEVDMFFFKTSPLLVFPLGYYTYKLLHKSGKLPSLLLALTYLFTLWLSGTRANILAATLVFILIVFHYLYKRKSKLLLGIAVSTVVLLIFIFISNASFKEKEASQEAKSNHVEAYVKLWNDHPQYLVFGQGLGSEIFSKGFEHFRPQTELTYFDIIRMFGIPLGVLFIVVTIYPLICLVPVIKFSNEVAYLVISFTSYLFIAGTNPLLISSTGILAMLCMLSAVNFFSVRRLKAISAEWQLGM